ncbi:hypothetical protein SH601_14320 [Gracilibacillus sp. S3-1-1]|uniref:Uncharacterized protein n=1 Tax=Gracilibacillus pellucidus TaxID=3095368 RepID=A0ACC6M8G8_9BACI|nr:hypothetical protein [Gracilibacillus sp. S3-1-1]MDX8047163.1 hypothetical protein [Gracilibacillus sp. S3-1-1]
MEHWEKWVPINGLPLKMYRDRFSDDKEGIVLELSDDIEKMKVVVKFNNGVLSYRSAYAGALLDTLEKLEEQYGTSFFGEWTLFKVKNSDYIKWFLHESKGVYQASDIEHYVFITTDDMIEVLATSPPSMIVMKG